MDRTTAQQLVQSVVDFLRSELSLGESHLSSESAESVEVAVQCLETAYGLPCNTHPILNLTDVYKDALTRGVGVPEQPRQQQTSQSSSQPVVSDDDKALAEQLKSQGNTFMGEENFEKSLECYSKALEKDPMNAVYYCNRAAALSKLGKHDLAVKDCQKALELQPEYSKAYGRMGLAYSSMQQHQLALDSYKKALELEPGNEGFARNLAIAEQALSSAPPQPANPFAGLLGAGGGLGAAFNSSGTPDLGGLLSNPNLVNMATQLMADPNMQNMMANILGTMGGGPAQGATTTPPPPPPPAATVPPPAVTTATTSSSASFSFSADATSQQPPQGFPGVDALFSAGRQLAEQMQNQHPELLNQLRTQMGNNNQPNDQQQPPQP